MPTTVPTSLASSKPLQTELSTQDKAAIGTLVPAAFIICALISVLGWRRHQRLKQAALRNSESKPDDNTQPYFQQKAELEDEERRRHELEVHETTYEVDGNDSRFEVEGDQNGHQMMIDGERHRMPSQRNMQELRGEEHSRELE